MTYLNLEENAKIIAKRAIQGLNPESIEIGSYTTVLSPMSVNNLLWFIASATSSESIYSQSSFLRDKLGDKVFSNQLSIKDDKNNLNLYNSEPFDHEGVASESHIFKHYTSI